MTAGECGAGASSRVSGRRGERGIVQRGRIVCCEQACDRKVERGVVGRKSRKDV